MTPYLKAPRARRLWTALLLLAAAGVHAAIVEEVVRVPVQARDTWGRAIAQDIVVTLWRDDQRAGPLPVVMLGHGRSPEDDERARLRRGHMAGPARWFVRLGYLAASPIRVGYGESGGPDVEYSGTCGDKVYAPGYAAAADQTLQVLAALRQRRDVLPDRAVIVGQSYGGTTAIALAGRNPPGVQAVVNFAGGGGGNAKTQPQRPCGTARLERLFKEYGQTARVPSMWIYTENDQFLGPVFPREWFAAFQAAGGVGVFAAQPAFGTDGHALFRRGGALWQPQVEAFLRSVDALPSAAAEPPTAQAR